MSEKKSKVFYIISIVFSVLYLLEVILFLIRNIILYESGYDTTNFKFVLFDIIPVIVGVLGLVFVLIKKFSVFASIFFARQILVFIYHLLDTIPYTVQLMISVWEYDISRQLALIISQILLMIIITLLFVLVLTGKKANKQSGYAATLITFYTIYSALFIIPNSGKYVQLINLFIAFNVIIIMFIIINAGNSNVKVKEGNEAYASGSPDAAIKPNPAISSAHNTPAQNQMQQYDSNDWSASQPQGYNNGAYNVAPDYNNQYASYNNATQAQYNSAVTPAPVPINPNAAQVSSRPENFEYTKVISDIPRSNAVSEPAVSTAPQQYDNANVSTGPAMSNISETSVPFNNLLNDDIGKSTDVKSISTDLKTLKYLFEDGFITEAEYEKKKAELLSRI